MPAKMWRHRFVVEGGGEFPYDMLRYDACYPTEESEARSLDSAERAVRRVTLEHRGEKSWKPTEGRWASFTWRVAEVISLEPW